MITPANIEIHIKIETRTSSIVQPVLNEDFQFTVNFLYLLSNIPKNKRSFLRFSPAQNSTKILGRILINKCAGCNTNVVYVNWANTVTLVRIRLQKHV